MQLSVFVTNTIDGTSLKLQCKWALLSSFLEFISVIGNFYKVTSRVSCFNRNSQPCKVLIRCCSKTRHNSMVDSLVSRPFILLCDKWLGYYRPSFTLVHCVWVSLTVFKPTKYQVLVHYFTRLFFIVKKRLSAWQRFSLGSLNNNKRTHLH